MKKTLLTLMLLSSLMVGVSQAEEITPISDIVKMDNVQNTQLETPSSNPEPCSPHHVTGRTVLAGAASFFVWPGIGQAINDNKGSKVATHAVLGALFPPFRFWSAYDATVDRKCGYWKGRI